LFVPLASPDSVHSSSRDSTTPYMPPTPHYSRPLPENATPLPLPSFSGKETKNPSLPTSPRSARRCTDRSVASIQLDRVELTSLQPEHVIAFLFAEMGTTGSVDGAGRLVIKGRFQQKQVENILRRYLGAQAISSLNLALLTPHSFSGVCHLQDLQIARHTAHQGEPYLLCRLRVLRKQAVRQCYQERFPGPSWKTVEEQDWLSFQQG